MASDAPQDVTVVGRRLRRRVLLALGLFGVLPVLVLAYAVHRYVFTDVTALRGVNLFGLQGLAFFTLLAMIGGAWIILGIGRGGGPIGKAAGRGRGEVFGGAGSFKKKKNSYHIRQ